MNERQSIEAERCAVLTGHVARLIETERIFTEQFREATNLDDRIVSSFLAYVARKQRRWLIDALQAGEDSESIANYIVIWSEDVVRVVKAGGLPMEVAS